MLVCDYCKHKMTRDNIRTIKIQVYCRPWEDDIEREFEICPQCASKLIKKLEEDTSEAEKPMW